MIELTVPAPLQYRDLVTRAVATACRIVSTRIGADAAATTDLTNAMLSAVGEAFNNVVEHANAGLDGGSAKLTISYDPESLTVELTDDGEGFDIDAVPDPDLDALPESGMGVFIIRAFVDEVIYERGPPNVLKMKKRLVAATPPS